MLLLLFDDRLKGNDDLLLGKFKFLSHPVKFYFKDIIKFMNKISIILNFFSNFQFSKIYKNEIFNFFGNGSGFHWDG